MLQNVAAEIITCYERARLAREKSERAINKECKAEFLAAEDHWLGWPSATSGNMHCRERSPN